MASVNGSPGLVVRDGGGVLTVVAFTVDRGRITALDVIRNPDKLTALPKAGPFQPVLPGQLGEDRPSGRRLPAARIGRAPGER